MPFASSLGAFSRRLLRCVVGVAGALLLAVPGCTTTGAQPGPSAGGASSTVLDVSRTEGGASYYADKFNGRSTASGEVYDPGAFTAAHRTLPFGTKLRVTRLDTGASVVVRVNDRGPFKRGRIVDLSKAAARKLDMIRDGVVDVRIESAGASRTVDAKPARPAPTDRTSTSW